MDNENKEMLNQNNQIDEKTAKAIEEAMKEMNGSKKEKTKFTKFVDFFSVLALSVMVILTFINAVLRYCFQTSLPAAEELSRFAFVWITYLGIIVAYMTGDHVAVTLLVDKLKGKTKFVFRIIRDIIIIATMGTLIWGGIGYVQLSNYLTLATKTNFMFVSSSLAICAVAVVVLCIIDFVKDLKNEKGGK